MRKGDIDWKSFAESLLWHNIVYHKNEYSGYEQGDVSGEIGNYSIRSIFVETYHKLTWKQLALELGSFTDQLISDGHDCKVCPDRKGCRAYFKDDPDQERCNGWKEEYNKLKTSYDD
jgi:hypothetical protein